MKLNPMILDKILDEFLFNNILFSDKSIKIEVSFMNILECKVVEAYPKFEHKLTTYTNSLLTKAEIAGYL